MEGLNASISAASKPTDFPPKSFPMKYITKTARVPKMGANMEQKDIKSMLTPSPCTTSYRAAAVVGRDGRTPLKSIPPGKNC